MLTGLELRLIGLIWSNSALFSTPGYLVSPVEKEKGGGKNKEEGKEGIRNRKGKEGRKKE